MGCGWDQFRFQLHKVLWLVLIFHWQTDECLSLNHEGLALLEFQSRVEIDPFGAIYNWNPGDKDPCNWSGIRCTDGKVTVLDLKGLSLRGVLVPELGRLSHLKALIWQRSLQQLKKTKPFTIPLKGKFLQFLDIFLMLRDNTSSAYVKERGENLLSPADTYIFENAGRYAYSAHRRLLQEGSNVPAAPANGASLQETVMILSIGSGSFPAVPFSTSANGKNKQAAAPVLPSVPPVHSPPMVPVKPILSGGSANKPSSSLDNQSSGTKRTWEYVLVLPGAAFLLTIAAGMLVMCQMHGRPAVGPWKTGLSGQLQKAFIAGVPKINRAELEAACEDFSNIVQTFPHCTVFKGTLSSGVEIAVVSTAIASSKDWSKHSEMLFQKKIDSLSQVNHKNFANLLGYCEEDEPFMRMMVFEYAPNGTLFDHLHVKGHEHLDWGARMRIIMGIAYCLQYMHHELKPPLVHPNLRSSAIYLTEDYAVKVAEIGFWKEFAAKEKISGDDGTDLTESPFTHTGSNIYDFGILLLEIISGRHPYSEEQGSILNWAVEYLNDKCNVSYMIDPTLNSFKNTELVIICEIIQDCIHQDPKTRPTMKEITTKLREVTSISPESATPRLSPLWWAELEILSVEAS